jgi:hypothetical protein
MKASVQLNIPPMAVRTSDGRAKTAKASIRKPDTETYYASLGGCIEDVRCAFGLTLEAFAYELKMNDRQLARQIKGEDRPQLEKVFAVERFRGPLVIALARLSADVDVVTEIRVRRSA